VEEAIEYHSLQALPDVRRWIDQLKYLERESPDQLAEWFADDNESRATARAEHVREIESLREAARVPARWRAADSKRLAGVLYSMRCAVIHPNLSTANALALRILPALRKAIIELVIARASQLAGMPLAAGRALFGAGMGTRNA
jgi:hypothetical protein